MRTPFPPGKCRSFTVPGQNRADAIRKMRSALGEVVVDGITTNLDFQYDMLDHPVFLSGNITTHFIPEYYESQESREIDAEVWHVPLPW